MSNGLGDFIGVRVNLRFVAGYLSTTPNVAEEDGTIENAAEHGIVFAPREKRYRGRKMFIPWSRVISVSSAPYMSDQDYANLQLELENYKPNSAPRNNSAPL